MTTPPNIEKLMRRARAAGSNLGSTCADALEFQDTLARALEKRLSSAIAACERYMARIAALEAQLAEFREALRRIENVDSIKDDASMTVRLGQSGRIAHAALMSALKKTEKPQ